MSINFEELRELLGTISQTDITELTLKSEEFELTVRKGTQVIQQIVPETVPMPVTPSTVKDITAPTQTISSPEPTTIEESPNGAAKNGDKWVAITSPMVGTFYRAPAPEEEPFVEIGDIISKGQVVCIIEAMKLMNEIESEVAGTVKEILVENGTPVEYGQILMWVEPT
ncbi:MAG: acetyl-CoA carboxylase biotin carboxyl carrier protein [Cyanobacteria bacterium J083]|nr:MAG: acetyl-CoA carboxylase biotin carboxyl carrier protein [Cyanobacteria bacterium J083]